MLLLDLSFKTIEAVESVEGVGGKGLVVPDSQTFQYRSAPATVFV
jgi:hypothetical protein